MVKTTSHQQKEFREDREIRELNKDISDSFQTGKMRVNSEQQSA